MYRRGSEGMGLWKKLSRKEPPNVGEAGIGEGFQRSSPGETHPQSIGGTVVSRNQSR